MPPSDDDLMRALRNGDHAALAELYNRHKHHLYRFALRVAGETAIAEDAIHDAFLKLCERPGQVATPGGARPWLFAVVRNTIFLRFRKENREGELDDELLADPDTPESILEAAERQALSAAILGRLKPEYREVLVLREYEHLSYAEIAGITGDSESSVKSRLFKARKALATGLSQRRHDHEHV
jgi:RNA polymerase sigma-70 factor (ECF subfamily)